jgi:hypothetical protein
MAGLFFATNTEEAALLLQKYQASCFGLATGR